MIEQNNNNSITSQIATELTGLEGMALSKFVSLNLDSIKEFHKFHVPQKQQAQMISQVLNRTVSVSSLAVAVSRLQSKSNSNSVKHTPYAIIVEKSTHPRFVPKDAILTLGTQKEKIKILKNGCLQFKEIKVDWRGLAPSESLSSWIVEHKAHLSAINLTGWRWSQIALAVTKHLNLSKPLTTNTLTSIISISNKANALS